MENLTFTELANISKAEFLLKSWSKIDIKWGSVADRKDKSSQKKILKNYIEKLKNIEPTLYHSHIVGGRLYAIGVSLQNIKREIRNYICSEYYNDYDMVNCQPNGLNEMCKKIGLKCDYLNDYCINRSTWYHLKQEITEVLFSDNFVRPLVNEIDYLYLTNLNKDFENIKDYFIGRIEHQDTIKALRKTKKGENIRGRLMSKILQQYENKILLKAFEFITFPINNSVFMFDGFMQPKDDHINCEKLNAFILTELDEVVKFIIKPFGIPLTFVEPIIEGTIIYDGEREASKLFLNELNGRLIRSHGEYFFKADTGLWIKDFKSINNALIKLALNLNYKVLIMGTLFNYSSKLCNAKNIVHAVLAIVPETPTFLTELFESTLGKICWNDGWYDFKTKIFTDNFDDIKTTIKISRNFPKRIEADITELYDRIINPIFGNLAETSLQSFSRSLAGILDKTWRVIIGERNSGKSKWIDLLKTAFEIYSVVVAGDNFIFERAGNGGDKAKKNSWMICVEFARFCNTSEIKIDESTKQKIDGVCIKSFSGCDEIQVRNNYTNERAMKSQAGLSINGNDIGSATPTDVYETMFPINLPNKFVELDELNPEYPFMKLKDETIDDLVKETRIGDALFWVLVDHFSLIKPQLTPEMKDFRDQFLEQDDFKVVNEIFTITQDSKDKVENKEIEQFIRYKQLNMTLLKLKSYLLKRGAKEYKSGNKRGLSNLVKLKEINFVEEN
jgi:hypothetical protein